MTEPEQSDKNTNWLRRYLAWPTLVVVGVVCYFTFFSELSVMKKFEYQRTIDSLQQQVQVYRDTMMYYRELNRRLSTDPEMMEKVVREHYNMKRPSEDIFVMENDSRE